MTEHKHMTQRLFKRVDILRGPHWLASRPISQTSRPIELCFFTWNIKGVMPVLRKMGSCR